MPVYKVTIGLRMGDFKATESYYSKSTTLPDLGKALTKLLTLRQGLAMPVVSFVGVRVGLAEPLPAVPGTHRRRSQFYRPGKYMDEATGFSLTVPEKGEFGSAALLLRTEQPRDALQVRLRFDGDRIATRYLSFIPNSIRKADPENAIIGEDPAWETAFNVFRNNLKDGGWQVRGRARSAGYEVVDIIEWTQSGTDPKDMGVVVPSATAPPYVAGEFVQILSARRKGTDKQSYNGRYAISNITTTGSAGKTTVFLRGTAAGNPNTVKLLGKIQRIGYAYYGIDGYLADLIGTHKRGNSFGSRRGRRSTRASLDP